MNGYFLPDQRRVTGKFSIHSALDATQCHKCATGANCSNGIFKGVATEHWSGVDVLDPSNPMHWSENGHFFRCREMPNGMRASRCEGSTIVDSDFFVTKVVALIGAHSHTHAHILLLAYVIYLILYPSILIAPVLCSVPRAMLDRFV